MVQHIFAPHRDKWWVAAIALVTAVISARPYAGGWNDGSRLAAVESLAERETFVIGESVFVRVPRFASPYDPNEPRLIHTGTLDKLLINGQYYSDKSPVPSLVLAGAAKVLQSFGVKARDKPKVFCWWLNFIGGGLCFIAAIGGIFKFGGVIGLPRHWRLALTASFAFGTIALPYSRHVNNHIQLLAVISWLLPCMIEVARRFGNDLRLLSSSLKLPLIGLLAGLGYVIDLGIGPVLFVCVCGWLVWRCRDVRSWRQRFALLALFGAGALPLPLLHHVVNYQIAGTIIPANAVAEFLQWPGSPFDTGNMTGRWQHDHPARLLIYGLEMMIGRKGFLAHNLTLVISVAVAPMLLRLPMKEKPEFVCMLVFSVLAFVVYAVTSNNYSGRCLSIRWFVPLLAPAYIAIALAVRARPEFAKFFVPFALAGAAWSLLAWRDGPWTSPPLVQLWVISSLAWIAFGWLLARRVEWTRFARQLLQSRRIRFGASILTAKRE